LVVSSVSVSLLSLSEKGIVTAARKAASSMTRGVGAGQEEWAVEMEERGLATLAVGESRVEEARGLLVLGVVDEPVARGLPALALMVEEVG
jgi:hypothetical protein